MLESAANFRHELLQLERDQLDAFAVFVLDQTLLCTLTVHSAGVARQIFVTTNDRGLRLNQSDVFKSQITSVATSDDAAAHIVKVWSEIDELFPDKENFYDFLAAVDVLTRRTWTGPEGLTQLGDFIIANFDEPKIVDWINRLRRLADAWKTIFAVRHPEAIDPMQGNLRRLHFFGWREWHPLALFYVDQYLYFKRTGVKKSVEAMQRRFRLLHKRCMGFTLARLSEGARQAAFRKSLNWAYRQANPFSRSGPLELTDGQKGRVRQATMEPMYHEDIYRPFARWYESMLWNNDVPSRILAATVEHVLPKAVDPTSEWTKDFPAEETRLRLAHQAGNLCLLTEEDNIKAGRAPFREKKKIYRSAKWKAKMTDDVSRRAYWTPEIIEQRTLEISTLVLERLDMQKLDP